MSGASKSVSGRRLIQRPDYRNCGKYQFIVAYGGGMQTVQCVHLSAAEVAGRCLAKLGPGALVDDGVDLWWESAPDPPVVSSPGDPVVGS